MSDEESSKSENNNNSEEDESLGKKEQNLFQVNEIEDEKRKEKELNTLLKKRKKKSEFQDANFDTKKKKINNGYCKSPKEFGKKNCDIREIKDEEESLQNIRKDNIFDPEAFIERYNENTNSKQPISLKEICPKIESKDFIIPKSMSLNPEIYKIVSNGNELMKSMIEKETLDTKQRKNFNELISEIKKMDITKIIKEDKLDIIFKKDFNVLISEIKKMDITKIIKEDKLDIIFDLDNTCIYAFIVKIEDYMNLKQKFPEKKIKLFNLYMNGKTVYFCLIIREGLREFINYAKPFCNFHINTLGIFSYGEAIKNILEKVFREFRTETKKLCNI